LPKAAPPTHRLTKPCHDYAEIESCVLPVFRRAAYGRSQTPPLCRNSHLSSTHRYELTTAIILSDMPIHRKHCSLSVRLCHRRPLTGAVHIDLERTSPKSLRVLSDSFTALGQPKRRSSRAKR
jgi:hypothetical protein